MQLHLLRVVPTPITAVASPQASQQRASMHARTQAHGGSCTDAAECGSTAARARSTSPSPRHVRGPASTWRRAWLRPSPRHLFIYAAARFEPSHRTHTRTRTRTYTTLATTDDGRHESPGASPPGLPVLLARARVANGHGLGLRQAVPLRRGEFPALDALPAGPVQGAGTVHPRAAGGRRRQLPRRRAGSRAAHVPAAQPLRRRRGDVREGRRGRHRAAPRREEGVVLRQGGRRHGHPRGRRRVLGQHAPVRVVPRRHAPQPRRLHVWTLRGFALLPCFNLACK